MRKRGLTPDAPRAARPELQLAYAAAASVIDVKEAELFQ